MAKKGNTRSARKLGQKGRKTRRYSGGMIRRGLAAVGTAARAIAPQTARPATATVLAGVNGAAIRAMASTPGSLFHPSYKIAGTTIPANAIGTFSRPQLQSILKAYGVEPTPRAPMNVLLAQTKQVLKSAEKLIEPAEVENEVAEPAADVEEGILNVEQPPAVEKVSDDLLKEIQEKPLPAAAPDAEAIAPPSTELYSISAKLSEASFIFNRYFSPKAQLQHNLSTLTKSDAVLFRYLNTRTVPMRGIITPEQAAKFKRNMIELLYHILGKSKRSEINAMMKAFTPKRIADLRLALFSLYIKNEIVANNVVDLIFSDIIPRNKYSPDLLDAIITILKDDKFDNIYKNLKRVSDQITGTSLTHAQETLLAELKGKGWFKAQWLYKLLMYGLGALVVSIFICNDIFSLESLTFKLKQAGGIPGLLESAQARFEASNLATELQRMQANASSKAEFIREKELNPIYQIHMPANVQKNYQNWLESKRPKGLVEQARGWFTIAPKQKTD